VLNLIGFNASRLIKVGAMLTLSVLLLGVGVWFAGGKNILADLKQFSFWTVATVFIFFVLNLVVVTLRLSRLLQYLHIKIPYSVAFKATLQGQFTSLFLISLFGQVAGRQLVLRHYGITSVFIAAVTTIEKFTLFIVGGFFCLLGASWLLGKQEVVGFLGKISFTQIVFVVILSFIASLYFGKSKFEARLLMGIGSRKSIAQFFKITFITALAQMLVLGAFVLGVMALAPDISFTNLLAAATITSFAASLPISVNGWGVREIAAIFAFGHLGVEPSSALAVSILVGLCSTAAVLIIWPYALKKEQKMISNYVPVDQKMDALPVEKVATWGLVTASAILIFFQIHISLDGGVVNLSLADPFAVLALAVLATHSFYIRQLPKWRIPKFNFLLLVVGCILLIAFFNGLQIIGVTQWALASRLFGWLTLLGYLSIGVLTVSYLGREGIKRFIESMIITIVTVILFHAFSRWFIFSGWIDTSGAPLNFEGFSGNRNAFAFQLLACSVLWLACIEKNNEAEEGVIFHSLSHAREKFLVALHGIILAGIVFTGSRAGMLTGTILILVAGLGRFVNRITLLKSIIFGFIIWIFFTLMLPWISQIFAGEILASFAVQSIISHEISNLERWETIRLGLAMWWESPLIGAGLGVFIETSTQWFDRPIVIHSTPVWLLAEFGVLGAGALFLVLGWVLVATKRSGFKFFENRAVVMLLGVFLVFGLAHEIFYQRIFWLVLGICIALPFVERTQKILSRGHGVL
jgi:uncharacterized membrane protein YbhN (UPF0104 family)